ncbi:MAG: Nucleotide-binding protein Bxeno_A0336 [Burkholderia sp.]|jgi:UPF0042 nucleotide-binding protein
MRLIIVTGMSGGGKSIAIRQLEDCGYYCIDNLPGDFLPQVALDLQAHGIDAAAVAIDARSQSTFDQSSGQLKKLEQAGIDVRIFFLTASTPVLVQRFSETRRRHPLSTRAEKQDKVLTLSEAINRERELLAPLADGAAVIDTTGLLPSQLRVWIQQLAGLPQAKMTLTFESFAFKHGLPVAADLVFDVRCLPNPYYTPELRPLTGRDEPVAAFLRRSPLVLAMVDDIEGFIRKWLPHYLAQNRHYLTVAIGCTGGQHRSVFVAEELGRRFAGTAGVAVRHRIIEQRRLLLGESAEQSA